VTVGYGQRGTAGYLGPTCENFSGYG
jgi:hypothetical protein